MKKNSLFNEDISPACEYCEFGSDSADYRMVLCKKEGMVSPYYRCKRFRYNPVRRTPKRMARLPEIDPSDFVL